MGENADDMTAPSTGSLCVTTQMSQLDPNKMGGSRLENVSKVGPVSVKEMQTAKDIIEKSKLSMPVSSL